MQPFMLGSLLGHEGNLQMGEAKSQGGYSGTLQECAVSLVHILAVIPSGEEKRWKQWHGRMNKNHRSG